MSVIRASSPRPVVLVIRDGWGENPHPEHDAFNAVKLARTPVADQLGRAYPSTLIKTSGEDVGLPMSDEGPTMGNSEVGHQNIGAGRIVDQELMRITRAIRNGSFFNNSVLRDAFAHASAHDGCVHVIGLVSNGQVHSDLDHLFALIDLGMLAQCPSDRLVIHAFTDGRDTPPRSSLHYLGQLEEKLRSAGIGRVGSVIGRFYAMDRDHRWERVERAYTCLTRPIERRASSAVEAARVYHAHPTDANRASDEFVEPTQLPGWRPIADNDAVIFFNFRGDRPRELTKAFVLDDEAWPAVLNGGFARGRRLSNLYFATMTGYEAGLPVHVVFQKPPRMMNILGEAAANAGRTQFRCAETEKFPHVTFFFNDYREEPFNGESRTIVPSPRDVATYDFKPEMSASEVRDAVLARLRSADVEDLIVVNFANGDMVGHTGSLEAAIRACEVVDECVGAVVDLTLGVGGELIITADHGNAEQMWDPVHNCPHTAHTNYDVPLLLVGARWRGGALRRDGRLADIAPTLLQMMGLGKPAEMTGNSLIV
jgi:2,3-bisphosphoglycerate-independent phosphoglycerate mutase